MDEWLIIHTPDGPWCWRLGQPTDEERDVYVLAARVTAGFPAGNDWIYSMVESGWSVLLTFGEPHPDLMARATIGTVEELATVPPQGVADYAAAMDETARQTRMAGAQAALAELHPDDQATVVAAVARAEVART